ncbi:hypothetical protein FACS1894170_12700 [Planctomycetales bacterium]|nr:hypothetical protein FACS1894170_12700 [Planctomycetales bacterium]
MTRYLTENEISKNIMAKLSPLAKTSNLSKPQITFIAEIKRKVRQAQYDALKAVNVALINLYWEIGRGISEKQDESWGKAIVPTLSKELQKEFPGIGGFSEGNLWLMAQFYNEYSAVENLAPLVREISWTKHVVIHQIDNQTYEQFLIALK